MSAQRLSATAHGVQIEICASESSVLDCVRARLPGGSRKTAHATGVAEYAFWKHPTEDFYALSLNGTWLVSPAPLDSVFEFFEPFLIMRIAERAAKSAATESCCRATASPARRRSLPSSCVWARCTIRMNTRYSIATGSRIHILGRSKCANTANERKRRSPSVKSALSQAATPSRSMSSLSSRPARRVTPSLRSPSSSYARRTICESFSVAMAVRQSRLTSSSPGKCQRSQVVTQRDSRPTIIYTAIHQKTRRLHSPRHDPRRPSSPFR